MLVRHLLSFKSAHPLQHIFPQAAGGMGSHQGEGWLQG